LLLKIAAPDIINARPASSCLQSTKTPPTAVQSADADVFRVGTKVVSRLLLLFSLFLRIAAERCPRTPRPSLPAP